MHIRFNSRGMTLIAGISGELDHHSSEYLNLKIDGEITRTDVKNLIFDFTKVSFMDSSGIGVIMGRYKSITRLGGKSAIVNANDRVRRIFELSGIHKYVPMFDSVNDAVNSFQKDGNKGEY